MRAARAVHGKTSRIAHDGSELFAGLPSPLEVGRYHSLTVERASLPDSLRVTATAERRPDGDPRAASRRASRVGRAVPPRVGAHARRQAAAAQLSRSRRRMRSALLAALFAPAVAGAQQIVLREPGPERVAAIVRDGCGAPARAARRRAAISSCRATARSRRTCSCSAGAPISSSHVEGDVVVVGGDLFLRPGSTIDGRAIAIGGGVYRTLPRHRRRRASRAIATTTISIRSSGSGYELAYAAKRATGRRSSSSPVFRAC